MMNYFKTFSVGNYYLLRSIKYFTYIYYFTAQYYAIIKNVIFKFFTKISISPFNNKFIFVFFRDDKTNFQRCSPNNDSLYFLFSDSKFFCIK